MNPAFIALPTLSTCRTHLRHAVTTHCLNRLSSPTWLPASQPAGLGLLWVIVLGVVSGLRCSGRVRLYWVLQASLHW